MAGSARVRVQRYCSGQLGTDARALVGAACLALIANVTLELNLPFKQIA